MAKPWIVAALLAGLFYLVVGIVFGELAGRAPSPLFWRRAAWLASAMAFAAHIGYERLLRRNSPAVTALHASLAVALGTFALAAAATIHSASTGTGNRRLLALALVVWPVLAGVPAFLVALATAALLARGPRRSYVSRRPVDPGRHADRMTSKRISVISSMAKRMPSRPSPLSFTPP